MRFDIHLRSSVQDQITEVAQQMKAWEDEPRISAEEREHLYGALTFFNHTTHTPDLRIIGVDGSGDFPALSYADSFVYVSLAQAVEYHADSVTGLFEPGPVAEPLVRMAWVPEDEDARHVALDQAFADLAGMSLRQVVEHSDYRLLKNDAAHKNHTVEELIAGLIRPHAADAGNIGLQLRSTAELGALSRQLGAANHLSYALMDGTFSLPMVMRRSDSLFYEHLKRLCCVKACTKGIGFFAISKSHGLPAMELIEEIAAQKKQLETGVAAEHWFLRLPSNDDDWSFSLAHGRQLPPIGAVTYLFRLHRTTPVLRLDMDRAYWDTHVRGLNDDVTLANEQRIFEHLDYASHDQRAYGYPYPLKAAHDRASLTRDERIALRKQIQDAAIGAGMRRALFRDASQATGHR